MNTIFISIIITTHNRRYELEKALDSAINQDFVGYEIIVVSDNSNEETKQFILEYKNSSDKNIKVIHISQEESKGANYARNIGIQSAVGEYICLLDDDDEFTSDKLKKQFNMITRDDSIGLVYCGSNRIIDGKYLKKNAPKLSGDLSKLIFSRFIGLTSTLCIRKEVFYNVGFFDVNLSHWQDYEMIIRIAQCYRIEYVDEYLVNIHVNTKSNSRLSNQYDKWLKSVEYIKQKHNNLIEKLPQDIQNSFEYLILEDAANRNHNIGNKKTHRKNMYILWKKTRRIKYLFRSVFNLSANRIQIIKGKKI